MRKSSQKSHERKPKAQGLSLIANSHIPRKVLKKGNSGIYRDKVDIEYSDMSPIGDSSYAFSSEESILHARGYIRGRVM